MKFGRQMQNYVENSKYKCEKNLAVYNAFKDNIRKLADLKQQMSQKIILFRSTVTFWLCAAKWYNLFSERELTFMFDICRNPSVCLSICLSVCLSSVVCNVRAPYSGD